MFDYERKKSQLCLQLMLSQANIIIN